MYKLYVRVLLCIFKSFHGCDPELRYPDQSRYSYNKSLTSSLMHAIDTSPSIGLWLYVYLILHFVVATCWCLQAGSFCYGLGTGGKDLVGGSQTTQDQKRQFQ